MIPPFDPQKVLVAPWTDLLSIYGWVVVMGFLVALACGLLGNFLILRRMALVGDAISHSILPGIVVAFLIGRTRGPFAMFLGAVCAGMLTTFLIELIQRRSRLKQDAAIGIVFSTFFAVGVLLISLFAGHVDLDADCVLYGELGYAGLPDPVVVFGYRTAPPEILTMAFVCLLVIGFVAILYKELLVTCFDPALASSVGISPGVFHYALMALLSIVVVSAFKAVGAILVVATLILPGATAYLISTRLSQMLLLSAIHAAISAVVGMHLSVWLNCSVGAALVVAGAFLFGFAWLGTLISRSLSRASAARSTGASADPALASQI
jgi:manganese/zinc/iron transport system permease protein